MTKYNELDQSIVSILDRHVISTFMDGNLFFLHLERIFKTTIRYARYSADFQF
jgi:hypothetical protein